MFDCWGAFIEGSHFSRDKFDLNAQGNSYLGSKPTQPIRAVLNWEMIDLQTPVERQNIG